MKNEYDEVGRLASNLRIMEFMNFIESILGYKLSEKI